MMVLGDPLLTIDSQRTFSNSVKHNFDIQNTETDEDLEKLDETLLLSRSRSQTHPWNFICYMKAPSKGLPTYICSYTGHHED
jgi:hypothetical protein